MIRFRRKDFTIPEGHYTGPKDMDKVPGALEVIGKSALAGSGIGAVVGKILKDQTILGGAYEGGKYGTLAGLVLKFFLNYLHNPMNTVKYQEVDKIIRREFGIYRAAGITVGDSVDKRATVEEKFGFNDRDVTSYKVNVSVQNNQVTLYTFGMTDKELEQVSKVLDYYCKKYFSMEYSATVLNQKVNAYSVTIVFTNYQVISNFLMELSNTLGTKINLLDNKALVNSRITEGVEKQFSAKDLNKYDLVKLLGKSGAAGLIQGLGKGSFGAGISNFVMSAVLLGLAKVSSDELAKAGVNMPRVAYGNPYLEEVLKKLHYIEGPHYSVGEAKADVNISMVEGRFVITAVKGSKSAAAIDKEVWSKQRSTMVRVDTGKVIIYNYLLESKSEFEGIIKKFMNCRLEPNIFEG